MKKAITTISEELKAITRKDWIIASIQVIAFVGILIISQMI